MSDGTDGTCLTAAPGDPGQIRATGAGTKCRSSWGAEDMIGNLWEFTDEWHASLGLGANGTFSGIATWQGSLFNSDFTVNIASQARTTDDTEGVGMPAALNRGGSRLDSTNAGIFALDMMSSPNFLGGVNGFRCVIPR